MGFSSNRFSMTMFALVVSSVDEGVWAFQGGCKLVLVEQGDVRLDTRALVILVVNELDSLEVRCHGVCRYLLTDDCRRMRDCRFSSEED